MTGASTWEPPLLFSRIHQELRRRYADRSLTDDQRFDLLFANVDADGTGQVDRDEFARLCGDLGLPLSTKQIASVFAQLDTSGDGQLSRDELHAWLIKSY